MQSNLLRMICVCSLAPSHLRSYSRCTLPSQTLTPTRCYKLKHPKQNPADDSSQVNRLHIPTMDAVTHVYEEPSSFLKMQQMQHEMAIGEALALTGFQSGFG